METLKLIEENKKLEIHKADISGSNIHMVCLNNTSFTDVAMTNVKIEDANLSDIEIKYAQLGGAYIHDIGLPPKGHPAYDPDARQRPLRFEDCDLNGSTITNCDLSNVEISDCNISGLKINGVLIGELLKKG